MDLQIIENYFEIKTDWQSVLNLLYEQSDAKTNRLWIKIKERKPFNHIPELKSFCQKLNSDYGGKYVENCIFNQDFSEGRCNCPAIWHIDGPVISLGKDHISKHKDTSDAAYIQILGRSFWNLDGQNVVLNPSDIMFLPKTISHEVWGEGPRFGVLLFAIDESKKISL